VPLIMMPLQSANNLAQGAADIHFVPLKPMQYTDWWLINAADRAANSQSRRNSDRPARFHAQGRADDANCETARGTSLISVNGPKSI
jgi:hypothetical protein